MFGNNSINSVQASGSLVLKRIDNTFWYTYLAGVMLISFANTPIYSTFWVRISAFLFLYAGLYFGFCCFFYQPRFKAIYAARYAIGFFCTVLIWMLLQQFFLGGSYLNEYVYEQIKAPTWFDKESLGNISVQRTAWAILANIMVFVLFILTLLMLSIRKRVYQLVWLILAVCLIHSLTAIFAKYTGIYLIDKASLDGHFDAARGFFVNRNHLAAFIVLCISSAIALQMRRLINNKTQNKSEFVFSQFASWSFLFLLICFTCIFLAESRASILSFLAFVAFYFVFLFHNSKATSAKLNNKYIYFLAAVIIMSIAIAALFGQGIVNRFLSDGLTIGERSTQWAITWQAIKNQFLVGYGLGSYELVFQTFRGYADFRAVVYDQAHNDYLHVFLEQGFIGLFLWVCFLSSIFLYVIKAYRKEKSTLVCCVLFGGLISISAVLLQSMVDYPLQIMTIRSYFFVIIGLMFAAPTISHR